MGRVVGLCMVGVGVWGMGYGVDMELGVRVMTGV